MLDKTTLIRLYEPLQNAYARDKHPIEELADLSEIFGYSFISLVEQIDGEFYFHPMPDLWTNRHHLKRLNENDHPLDSPEGYRLWYVLALGRSLPAHNL